MFSVRYKIIFNVDNFRVQGRTIFRKFSRRSATRRTGLEFELFYVRSVFKVAMRKVSSVPVSFSFSVSYNQYSIVKSVSILTSPGQAVAPENLP